MTKEFTDNDRKNIPVYLRMMQTGQGAERSSATKRLNAVLKKYDSPIRLDDDNLDSPQVRELLEKYAQNPDLLLGEGGASANKELEDAVERWKTQTYRYAGAYEEAVEQNKALRRENE